MLKNKINQLILLNIKNKNQIKSNIFFIAYGHYKFNINKYLYLILTNIIILLIHFFNVSNISLKFNFYLNFFFYYLK